MTSTADDESRCVTRNAAMCSRSAAS
jgi:hypothetical protein